MLLGVEMLVGGGILLGLLGVLLYLAWQLHLQKRSAARRETGLRAELEEASVQLEKHEKQLRGWEQERTEERLQYEKEQATLRKALSGIEDRDNRNKETDQHEELALLRRQLEDLKDKHKADVEAFMRQAEEREHEIQQFQSAVLEQESERKLQSELEALNVQHKAEEERSVLMSEETRKKEMQQLQQSLLDKEKEFEMKLQSQLDKLDAEHKEAMNKALEHITETKGQEIRQLQQFLLEKEKEFEKKIEAKLQSQLEELNATHKAAMIESVSRMEEEKRSEMHQLERSLLEKDESAKALQTQLEEQSVKHKAELELTLRQAAELKGNKIQQLQLSHEEKEKELNRKLQSQLDEQDHKHKEETNESTRLVDEHKHQIQQLQHSILDKEKEFEIKLQSQLEELNITHKAAVAESVRQMEELKGKEIQQLQQSLLEKEESEKGLRTQLEEQSVKHKEEIELAQRQAVELKGNEIQQLQLSHEEKEKELNRKLQSQLDEQDHKHKAEISESARQIDDCKHQIQQLQQSFLDKEKEFETKSQLLSSQLEELNVKHKAELEDSVRQIDEKRKQEQLESQSSLAKKEEELRAAIDTEESQQKEWQVVLAGKDRDIQYHKELLDEVQAKYSRERGEHTKALEDFERKMKEVDAGSAEKDGLQEATSKALSEATQELESVREAAGKSREKLAKLQSESEEGTKQLKEREAALLAVNQEMASLREDWKKLSDHRDELQSSLRQALQDIGDKQNALQENEKNILSQEEKLKESSGAIAALEGEKGHLVRAKEEIATELARTKESLQSMASVEQDLIAARKEVESLSGLLKKQEESSQHSQKEVDLLRSNLAEANEECASLRALTESKEKEVSDLSAEMKLISSTLSDHHGRLAILSEQAAASEATKEELQHNLNAAQERCRSLEEEGRRAQRTREEGEALVASLRREVEQGLQQIKHFEAREQDNAQKSEKSINHLQEQHAATSSSLQQLREENSGLQERLRKMESSRAEDETKMLSLHETVTKQEVQIGELTRTNASLDAQAKELQGSMQRLEEHASSLLLQNDQLELDLKRAQERQPTTPALDTRPVDSVPQLLEESVSDIPNEENIPPAAVEPTSAKERETFIALDSQNLELLNEERDKLARAEKRPDSPSLPTRVAVALYDNKGTEVNEGELIFQAGDQIVVLEMTDEEWWLGCLKTNEGKTGYFPSAFVRLVGNDPRRLSADNGFDLSGKESPEPSGFLKGLNKTRRVSLRGPRRPSWKFLGPRASLPPVLASTSAVPITKFSSQDVHTEKELQQSFLIQQTLSKIDGEKEETGEALQEKVRRRKMLALELLETERSYVAQLGCVLKWYLEPLRETSISKKPLISSTDLRNIFGGVEVIYNMNSLLLQELEASMEGWKDDRSTLGHIFTQTSVYFKAYSPYVSSYSIALQTFSKYENDPLYLAFENTAKRVKACKGLSLEDFLIMPVQRIPRYVLLLEQLFSVTPKNHPDKKPLGEALAKVRIVADDLNESKREAESCTKVLTVQRKLTNRSAVQLYQPHRRFLREGDLSVWVPSVQKKNQQSSKMRRCFLFSDLMLVAKAKKKDTLHSKQVIYTNSVSVIDLEDSKEDKNAFALSHGGADYLIKFSCVLADEKYEWMRAITNSMAVRISVPEERPRATTS